MKFRLRRTLLHLLAAAIPGFVLATVAAGSISGAVYVNLPHVVIIVSICASGMGLVGRGVATYVEAILFVVVYYLFLFAPHHFHAMLEGMGLWGVAYDMSHAGIAGMFGVTLASSLLVWILVRVKPVVAIDPENLVCPYCSYDLAGNITGMCPECGANIPYADSGLTKQEFLDIASKKTNG